MKFLMANVPSEAVLGIDQVPGLVVLEPFLDPTTNKEELFAKQNVRTRCKSLPLVTVYVVVIFVPLFVDVC